MTEIIRLDRELPIRGARFTVAVEHSFWQRLAFGLGVRIIKIGCLLAGLRFEAQPRVAPLRITRAFADEGTE